MLIATAIAKRQATRSFELRASLSLAKLYESTGRRPSASGHANPAAAARFRLSWIVERATPRRRPISRALTPSW